MVRAGALVLGVMVGLSASARAEPDRVSTLGEAALRSHAGDHAGALRLYERAYAADRDVDLLTVLGAEYRSADRPLDAIQNFCAYLAIEPDGPHAAFAAAQLRSIQAEHGFPAGRACTPAGSLGLSPPGLTAPRAPQAVTAPRAARAQPETRPMTLAFSLDRTIEVRAPRSIAFRFFADAAHWARWWGPGSTIDPVVGGALAIVFPGGERITGTVRELDPERRIAFTYGYEAAGRPIAPGGSLVTITLDELPGGATRLVLRHDVATAEARDAHVQGWRYQLARLADAIAGDAFAGASAAVTAWFAAWNEPDADRRRAALRPIVSDDVRFRDGNGDVYGFDELINHVGAVLKFMPGLRLEARGTLRRGHDVALVDWAAVRPDGSVAMTGTNVVRFAADGRIADVVGIP